VPGQLQRNVARRNVDTVDARRTRPHIRGEEIRAGLINDNWARAFGLSLFLPSREKPRPPPVR
jgi:hypothetical protein